MRILTAALLAALLGLAIQLGAQAPRRNPVALLTGGLNHEQLSDLEHGEVVVEDVETAEHNDVAVMGVAHIGRSRAEIIELARAGGHAIGAAHGLMQRFPVPATRDQMAALRLNEDDLKHLARCEPGACNTKLASADMTALRAILTAGAPDAPSRAEDYLRGRLVEYVDAYRRDGDAAMPVYGDRPVHSGRAFESMLQDSCRLSAVAPELTRFLVDYPRSELPGESSVIYWTLDSLPRARPTLRIVHEVTWTPADDMAMSIVATKQVYANHYFEAGLEILAAVDDSAAGVPGVANGATVVIVRHYRFDQLPHIAFIDLRGRVVARLRDAVEHDLERLQR
jgi:hypothetical protein